MNILALRTRERSLALLQAAAIMLTSAFFSLGTASWHTLIVAAGLCSLSGFMKKPLRGSSRSVIYLGVIALAVSTICLQAFRLRQDAFHFLPGHVAIPFFLFLAALYSLLDQQQAVRATINAILLTAFLSSLDIRFDTSPNRWLLIDHTPRLVYAAYIIPWCLIMGLLCQRSLPGHRYRQGSLYWRLALLPAAALIVLILAFFSAQSVTDRLMSRLQAYDQHTISMLSNLVSRNDRKSFENSRIGPRHGNKGDDSTLMIIARGTSIPSHLRFKAFDTYSAENCTWSASRQQTTPLPTYTDPDPSMINEISVTQRYLLNLDPSPHPDVRKLDRVNLMCTGAIDIKELPSFYNSQIIELACGDAMVAANANFEAKELNLYAGFSLYQEPASTRFHAINKPGLPNPELQPQLYEIPDSIRLHVWRAFMHMPGLPTDPQAPDYAERTASVITAFFHENYTYSLKSDLRPEAEAVSSFLTRCTRGHCELFAASTVILLRGRGIPARYVTGFLVSPDAIRGEEALLYGRDLHAWVEYYDKEQQQWVPLDTTPGNGDAGTRPNPQGLSKYLQAGTIWLRTVAAWFMQGHAATFVANILFRGSSAIVNYLKDPLHALQISLLSILVTWLWRRLRRRALTPQHLPPALLNAHLASRKLATAIARRCGLPPADVPTLTLSELARIAAALPDAGGAAAAAALLEYEAQRHHPQVAAISLVQAEALYRKLHQATRSLR